MVPFQQPAFQEQTENKTETVYVTRTGKRYHRDGCRYLGNNPIPMSLKDAQAKGYTPCKVCHPPQ
jgi:competence protein ComEC